MFIALMIAFVLVSLFLIAFSWSIHWIIYDYPTSTDRVMDSIRGFNRAPNWAGFLITLTLWLVLLGTLIEIG